MQLFVGSKQNCDTCERDNRRTLLYIPLCELTHKFTTSLLLCLCLHSKFNKIVGMSVNTVLQRLQLSFTSHTHTLTGILYTTLLKFTLNHKMLLSIVGSGCLQLNWCCCQMKTKMKLLFLSEMRFDFCLHVSCECVDNVHECRHVCVCGSSVTFYENEKSSRNNKNYN